MDWEVSGEVLPRIFFSSSSTGWRIADVINVAKTTLTTDTGNSLSDATWLASFRVISYVKNLHAIQLSPCVP
jgi:hypothetical protein